MTKRADGFKAQSTSAEEASGQQSDGGVRANNDERGERRSEKHEKIALRGAERRGRHDNRVDFSLQERRFLIVEALQRTVCGRRHGEQSACPHTH